MIPDGESNLHNNPGLDSTAHRVLTIEPTIIHPQLSAGGWPLKYSISRFDDQVVGGEKYCNETADA